MNKILINDGVEHLRRLMKTRTERQGYRGDEAEDLKTAADSSGLE